MNSRKRVKNTLMLWLSSSVLTLWLSACSMVVPNVTVCGTGEFSAGADCAETLTGVKSQKNLDEWVAFLEPDPATDKGSALCLSSVDYRKMKDAIDYACKKLGRWCSHEVTTTVENVDANVTALQSHVMERRKKRDPRRSANRIQRPNSKTP